MLDGKGNAIKVDWPVPEDAAGETAKLSDYFAAGDQRKEAGELASWFGSPAGLEAF